MSPNARHYVEYGALRAMLGILRATSWRGAGAIGAGIATLGYRPLGFRRGVVERQIAACFPEFDEATVKRTAAEAYAHLGRTSVEAALLPSLGREAVLGLFDESPDWHVVTEATAEGKGIIFVTGHLGNWELAGAYVAARGVGLEAVARRMENPLFDGFLTRTRERIGMRVVHDADAVRRAPRALREGKAVAFLVDQGVLGLASTFVPFFGRPAKTPRGPAVFALRLGAPVVFGAALRQPSGKYVLRFERVRTEPTGDREKDVDRIVADYTNTLERWVRKAPGQYFWHHRRWKRQPEDTPPELREP